MALEGAQAFWPDAHYVPPGRRMAFSLRSAWLMAALPISVCMISGPEQARIGRALASVAGWTSEIIIVLNEDVADGTEEVARGHSAKVFRESWKGHIAQKNSAAEKASQPWIFG